MVILGQEVLKKFFLKALESMFVLAIYKTW